MSIRSPAAMSPSPCRHPRQRVGAEHRGQHVRLLRLRRAREPAVVALLEPNAHHLVALRVAPQRLAEPRDAPCECPGRRPEARASAGRANRWNVTIAETGLPGRPNTSVPSRRAEPGRLPGLKPHAPEALLDAELGERRLDVVVRADGHAAADAHDVGRVERGGERVARGRRSRRARALALTTSAPGARRLRGDARRRSSCGSGPGASSAPARPARRPSRAPRAAAACARDRSRLRATRARRPPPGRARCPRAMTVSPARTSSPARRTFAPGSVAGHGHLAVALLGRARPARRRRCPRARRRRSRCGRRFPAASGGCDGRARRATRRRSAACPARRSARRSRPSPTHRTAAGPRRPRRRRGEHAAERGVAVDVLGRQRRAPPRARARAPRRSRSARARPRAHHDAALRAGAGDGRARRASSSGGVVVRAFGLLRRRRSKSAWRQSASYAAATISVPDEPSLGVGRDARAGERAVLAERAPCRAAQALGGDARLARVVVGEDDRAGAVARVDHDVGGGGALAQRVRPRAPVGPGGAAVARRPGRAARCARGRR